VDVPEGPENGAASAYELSGEVLCIGAVDGCCIVTTRRKPSKGGPGIAGEYGRGAWYDMDRPRDDLVGIAVEALAAVCS